MRFQYLVCILLVGLAYGQAAPPTPPPAPPAGEVNGAYPPGSGNRNTPAPGKVPEVKVAPDDPVITLTGYCPDTTLQGDACKTVISRAQFEKLAETLQPAMSPTIRRQLATRYAWVLKMSAAAEKRGLDKGPAFEEKMKFARMQILSQELSSTLQADAGKLTDADLDEYYKANASSYEQATFMRIFVPRTKQIINSTPKPAPGAKASPPTPPTPAQQKAGEEAMKKLATDLRAKLVQGEDPDKLQKEAYTVAGLPGNAPTTKMEKMRRTTLPKDHQSVMDLKVGEVSEVISDQSGYYIYKVVSKDALPLDNVKAEITRTISSQRYRDSMQGYQGGVDLNDAYFGPTRNRLATPPSPGGKPSGKPDTDDD